MVFGAGPLSSTVMPRCLELGDDLAERLGAGGVEHLEVGQAQDHDPTSVTAVSSVRNRCAAPKNSAPSRR